MECSLAWSVPLSTMTRVIIVAFISDLDSFSALKHGAILYNEAEVFSLSITNPNGRPMLPFDWFIHSSLISVSCHRIFCFSAGFSAVEK